MKKQLFAALVFAGALTAWSMTAKAGVTVEADPSADFVVKNESHKTIVGFYLVPLGQKFYKNENWLLTPLADGQSTELHFFEVTPGPCYDAAVVYGDGTYNTLPFLDLAGLKELRAYVEEDGGLALETTPKDPNAESALD
jgi:hypothetical protein